MPTLDELCRYAAVDPGSDTDMLKICMDAAQQWFANAGVQPRADSSLYDMGVYMLATHYFDMRGAVYTDNRGSVSKASEHLPFGVFSIMHQLRNE